MNKEQAVNTAYFCGGVLATAGTIVVLYKIGYLPTKSVQIIKHPNATQKAMNAYTSVADASPKALEAAREAYVDLNKVKNICFAG